MAKSAAAVIKERAFKLSPEKIVERIPEEVDWVLFGEASHGSHEFYQLRANVTRLLIEQQGFNAVATEADFPDAFRVNQWVQHLSEDKDADVALSDFQRFPTWMWRNHEVKRFIEWQRDHNGKVPEDEVRQRSTSFYGLDIYSLQSSIKGVTDYLEKVDPEAAERAKKRYSCFDSYGADAINYAFALARGKTPCQNDAVKQLVDTLRKVGEQKSKVRGKLGEEEAAFAAECNARVVKDAETYYRSLFFADELTWNIRDKHMAETAVHIERHLKSRDIARPRVIIWAHNSHLGDARETCMGRRRGEFNLGQLMREKYGEEKVFIVGQSTHHGYVAAADEWGAPVQRKRVLPALPESHEDVAHQVGLPAFGLKLRKVDEDPELAAAVEKPRLQRAIGVIYRPDTERQSHYYQAWMKHEFDMLVHIDETQPVHPLDDGHDWPREKLSEGGLPDTFPFGV